MKFERTPSEGRLTHVECIYRPGERELARRLFELLGCRVVDREGIFFTAFVDPDGADYSTNVFYASEVTPEQWAFEGELARSSGAALERFAEARRAVPQRSFHFGFRVANEAIQTSLVERVRHAAAADEALRDRVQIDGVFRPGDPGALAPNMTQAFVWTDIVASGLLGLGQYIEVQWHHA